MRLLVSSIALCVALMGCRTRCSEEIVDRRGGVDATTTEGVRQALDVFASLLDPQYSLCIRKIRFKDDLSPDADHVATYLSNVIRIYQDHARDQLIWHELAHAVFVQNRLKLDEELFVLPDDLPFGGVRDARVGEAFAIAMESGPTYAQLLHENCPGDAPGVAQLRDAAGYFVGFDERSIFDDQRLIERAVFEDVPFGAVFKSTDEGSLIIQPAGDGPVFYVDMLSLSVGPLSPALVSWEDLQRVDGQTAGNDQGVVLPFTLPSIDSQTGATRWAFQQPGGVTQAFGCVESEDQVVEVAGALWMLRWLDNQLSLMQWAQ